MEGRNMEAYRHRFEQRIMWKEETLRAFKRLKRLNEGVEMLDEVIGEVFKEKVKQEAKWKTIQQSAKRAEKGFGRPRLCI
jgi:hypothetical protein